MLTPPEHAEGHVAELDPWWIMSHETTADKSSFGVSSGKPGEELLATRNTDTDGTPPTTDIRRHPIRQSKTLCFNNIIITTHCTHHGLLTRHLHSLPALLHVMRELTGSHRRRRRPLARRLHACVDTSVQRREFQGLLLDLHAPTCPRRVWSCAVRGKSQ